jgi:hypothetical protein
VATGGPTGIAPKIGRRRSLREELRGVAHVHGAAGGGDSHRHGLGSLVQGSGSPVHGPMGTKEGHVGLVHGLWSSMQGRGGPVQGIQS